MSRKCYVCNTNIATEHDGEGNILCPMCALRHDMRVLDEQFKVMNEKMISPVMRSAMKEIQGILRKSYEQTEMDYFFKKFKMENEDA